LASVTAVPALSVPAVVENDTGMLTSGRLPFVPPPVAVAMISTEPPPGGTVPGLARTEIAETAAAPTVIWTQFVPHVAVVVPPVVVDVPAAPPDTA
jgi:hypothetical protein